MTVTAWPVEETEEMARRHKPADRTSPVPDASVVRLDPDTFADLWWVAKFEGGEPRGAAARVIKKMIGTALAAKRKQYEAEIARLTKLFQEETRLRRQGRERNNAGKPE